MSNENNQTLQNITNDTELVNNTEVTLNTSLGFEQMNISSQEENVSITLPVMENETIEDLIVNTEPVNTTEVIEESIVVQEQINVSIQDENVLAVVDIEEIQTVQNAIVDVEILNEPVTDNTDSTPKEDVLIYSYISGIFNPKFSHLFGILVALVPH